MAKPDDFCSEEEVARAVEDCNTRQEATRKRKSDLHKERRKKREDAANGAAKGQVGVTSIRSAIANVGGIEAAQAYDKYLKQHAKRLAELEGIARGFTK